MTNTMLAFCLRCRKSYGEFPALSRRDNSTSICNDCGNSEATNDFTPWDFIPIIDMKIEKEFHETIGKNFRNWVRFKTEQSLRRDQNV